MTKHGICKAMIEAREFLKRADAVLDDNVSDALVSRLVPTAMTGALRRQSMELTRALAALRKA